MKILIISSSLEGGAGGSAYRLHGGLRRIGESSKVLVQSKSYPDDEIITLRKNKIERRFDTIRRTLDHLPLKIYGDVFFSPQWVPDFISGKIGKIIPDIINLHWVCNSFLRIEIVPKLKIPIVWTLHDMWPFTGGCFHTNECKRYEESCGACPILGSRKNHDISRWVWNRKAKAWKKGNITVVSPSSWLAECAKASSLFKDLQVEVIPNGLDTKLFKPIAKGLAREILNLPQDRKIVLFGVWTNKPLKGFHLFQEALLNLANSRKNEQIQAVIFGFSKPNNKPDIGYNTRYLGKINDKVTMALIYSAADVYVSASMHENLSCTIMEALSCGVPCVAFDIGGTPDLIVHKKNGYLAKHFMTEDLAQGIQWVLEDSKRNSRLRQSAREKIEKEFSLELQVQRYTKLFEGLL